MMSFVAPTLAQWESMGARVRTSLGEVFVLDRRGDSEDREPLLILHGFPSCSFDWRHVLGALAEQRRVVAIDMLGYGLSAKPDQRYSLFDQATIVTQVVQRLGLDSVSLVTHDMGDSVGGELLARAGEDSLPFTVTRRVITNGSIYMDLVQLSVGQQFLLALPDAMLPEDQAPDRELFMSGLAATFAPDTPPDEAELAAQWDLMKRDGGHRLLARLIRYVEERRVHEQRWTSAIEQHPSSLAIVWGDADPIAVYAMAERLARTRADATLTRLTGVGHYPMIEVPDQFSAAVLADLA